MENICAVCSAAAEKRCGACKVVYYCNSEHQKQHWPNHKPQCGKNKQESAPEAPSSLIQQSDKESINHITNELGKDKDGNLTKDSFLALRNAIVLKVDEVWRPQQEQITQLRLKAFKDEDWEKYQQFQALPMQQLRIIDQETTKEVIKAIGLTLESYQISEQFTRSDPAYNQKLQIIDSFSQAKKLLKATEFKESKSEITHIWNEKRKMEKQLFLAMETMPVSNPAKSTQLCILEMSKITDIIFLKFGVEMEYLMAAARHYGIKINDDIRAQSEAFDKLTDRAAASSILDVKTDREKQIIQNAILNIGDLSLHSQVLSQQQYEQVKSSIKQIKFEFRQDTEMLFIQKRLQLLKDQKYEAYAEEVLNRKLFLLEKEKRQSDYVFLQLKLSNEVWIKTKALYEISGVQNPSSSSNFHFIDTLEEASFVQMSEALLARGDTLKFLVSIYERTIKSLQMVTERVVQQKVKTWEVAQMMLEIESLKVYDENCLDYGIGGGEIIRATKEHNLRETSEIQALQQQYSDKLEEFWKNTLIAMGQNK